MKTIESKPRVYPVFYDLPNSKELIDWLYKNGFTMLRGDQASGKWVYVKDYISYLQYIRIDWTDMECTELFLEDQNQTHSIRYNGRFISDVEDFKALLFWIDFVKNV